MNRQQRRSQERAAGKARSYARSGHGSNTHQVRVVQAADRQVVLGGGRAVARMPDDFDIPAETFVWVGQADCGCAWGWTVDKDQATTATLTWSLTRAADVEALLDHTATHHLTPAGFSHQHLPVPGHTD